MDLIDLGLEGMVWFNLAKDRDKWQAVVDMVVNSRIPWRVEFLY
jgi:hypothetical protein